MSVYIRQLWQLFLLIFVTEKVEETPTTAITRDSRHAEDVEEAGRWYFKRDILNRLDEYFKIIVKMKKHDRDSYELYSRIGAVITSKNVGVWVSAINKIDGRVGFGAIFSTRCPETDDDMFQPCFIYFQKVTLPPATVQPTAGVVYEVVAIYLDPKPNRKMGGDLTHPAPAYVSIQPDGSCKVLKQLQYPVQRIRSKIPAKRRAIQNMGRTILLSKAQWKYPSWIKDIGEKAEKELGRKISIDEKMTHLFGWGYNIYCEASKDVRIRCEKDGVVGAFMVDLLRMPYFFADRETTVAVDGKKKRIFHIVRTHKRSFKTGAHTYVKSHFRGQRRFEWNGYGITISMPGKHHTDLLDATFGSHDRDQINEPRRRFLDGRQLGKSLDNHMRGITQ